MMHMAHIQSGLNCSNVCSRCGMSGPARVNTDAAGAAAAEAWLRHGGRAAAIDAAAQFQAAATDSC
jgi:hypothetical protein